MAEAKKLKLGVLVSGNGSNLQSIVDASEQGKMNAVVVVVISNNPDAYALKRAQKHNIPTVVVPKKNGEAEILKGLKQHRVDLVCLAGFMQILSPQFIKEYPEKIINIHPSLLPDFPGLHAQAKALAAGAKQSGATVHFVDEGCDTGPIILQAVVPIFRDDTVETLQARILKEEHRIYPQAIQLIATESLKIVGRGVEGKAKIK